MAFPNKMVNVKGTDPEVVPFAIFVARCDFLKLLMRILRVV